jgi:ribosomal protein S1
MRTMAPFLLAASLTLGGTAFAGEKTAADISSRCAEFKTAADKKTCRVAAKEVSKLAKEHVSGEVKVFWDAVEGDTGQLVLSRKRAKHMRTWERILRAESEAEKGKGETAKQDKSTAR